MKMRVSLKSHKNNGHLKFRPVGYIPLIGYRSVLLRMRNVSDKVVMEVKTLILFSMTLFSKIAPFMR